MAAPFSQGLSGVQQSTTLDVVGELKAEYVIQPLFQHSRNSWCPPPTSLCAPTQSSLMKIWMMFFQASNTPMEKSALSKNSIVLFFFFTGAKWNEVVFIRPDCLHSPFIINTEIGGEKSWCTEASAWTAVIKHLLNIKLINLFSNFIGLKDPVVVSHEKILRKTVNNSIKNKKLLFLLFKYDEWIWRELRFLPFSTSWQAHALDTGLAGKARR